MGIIMDISKYKMSSFLITNLTNVTILPQITFKMRFEDSQFVPFILFKGCYFLKSFFDFLIFRVLLFSTCV